MEKEDFSFLIQMIESMKDAVDKLEESYNKRDSLEFEKYKSAITKLSEEIGKKFNGK